VHWLSWREIFFVNVPIGLVAQWLIHRHMPDYRSEAPRPLDVVGLVQFGVGIALLSWLLEVFGEHHLDPTSAAILLLLSLSLLAAYGMHARYVEYPLLSLALFRVRTFRVSVVGGFVTRLGLGGLPFLLPLLYQLGLGLPAWESGLLMMPMAAAAMGMKLIAPAILARHGYRNVLIVNTLMIGVTISLYALVVPATPLASIVLLGLSQGLFNSLQFTAMNSMAYADIDTADTSMASTIASSSQQLSMSFGLACGSLVTAWFLGDLPQSNRDAVGSALHHAFLTLGVLTMLSSLPFWTLRGEDGESVSRGALRAARPRGWLSRAVDWSANAVSGEHV
jgi:Na+/melibiose symporter-like transporter